MGKELFNQSTPSLWQQTRTLFHQYRLRVLMIAIVIVGMIGVAVWQFDLLPWGKDYIDGNVLNLPYIAEWEEDQGIVSPWKNVQFHTTLMFRNLFLTDSSFENIEMDLAKSYQILEDGMIYEIVMKDDVVWSDNVPLTAEDVVFSIESVLLANDANGIYTTAFLNIAGASTFVAEEADHVSGLSIEGNTITIQMDTIYPAMMSVLAQFVILPKHALEDEDIPNLHISEFWIDPIVSGMYKIGEIIPFETVRLVRNEAYTEQAPLIDEVLLHIDYKNADLDYYSTNNTTEIINYRSMRGMEGYEVDTLFYRYFVFNLSGVDGNQNEAMQDPNVRLAIAYAINRESALADIYFDSGELIDSGVPRGDSDYNGVVIEYNPEEAIRLLAESDYDMSRPLRLLYYYTDSVSKYFMERVAEDLEAVGFQVEVSLSKSTTELYEDREYDLMLKGLSAFSLNEWYAEYLASNPNLSAIFGGDSPFETLVNDLNTQIESEEITATLLSLQALENEWLYKLPLFTLSQMLFIREDRVCIPDNITFGNTWYKYDVDFENWYILKERVSSEES